MFNMRDRENDSGGASLKLKGTNFRPLFTVLVLLVLGVFVVVSAESTNLELEEIGIDELQKVIQNQSANVVAVNVWATWCVPCREEFPDLIRLRDSTTRDQFELILVSFDFDPPNDGTLNFLESMGVDFKTYLKTGDDQNFIEGLSPEWTGAMPTTVWFQNGKRLETHEGKLDFASMKKTFNRYISLKP